MKKTCESQLPEGYVPVFTVDIKSKKLAWGLNIAAVVIGVIGVVLAWRILHPLAYILEKAPEDMLKSLRSLWLFAVLDIVYIVLHELAHGAAYKLMTRQKLTFGISLSCAYCGVPDILVYRRTALIALQTPFLLFIPVFLIPACVLDPWNGFLSAVLLSFHVGGCAGDLYDTVLLLFKYKDPALLMQDTGPKQTFYLPENL